ncbi:MAG: hypothetical protein ACXVBT_07095 [Flavisolibacter sp.]
MENEGFSEEVKQGFLLCLLCSDRAINELIQPNLQDQPSALINQFSGMTDEQFTYEEYGNIRKRLVTGIYDGLSDKDKAFLLSVKNVGPDWSFYDFRRFPSINWKLQNLKKLRVNNPDKHKEQYVRLKEQLSK